MPSSSGAWGGGGWRQKRGRLRPGPRHHARLDLPLGRGGAEELKGVPETVIAPARVARISCWMILQTELSNGSGAAEDLVEAPEAPDSGAETGVDCPSRDAINEVGTLRRKTDSAVATTSTATASHETIC